jgi:hypothetical protein
MTRNEADELIGALVDATQACRMACEVFLALEEKVRSEMKKDLPPHMLSINDRLFASARQMLEVLTDLNEAGVGRGPS